MCPELDKTLCEKYPKIFKNRYGNKKLTAMCWGFECNNGWYNIIDKMCSNIQSYIDWKRKQRADALRYNRCLRRAINGNVSSLEKYFSSKNFKKKITEYDKKLITEAIKESKFRSVPEKIEYVVADQIKEKFGTLRFYYSGGNEYIAGIVSMSESMSSITCETCGLPGKIIKGGWLKVACEKHANSKNFVSSLDY